MKNNINKERIIDMLCSEDIELREVGINLIKSNYKMPSKVYINTTGPFKFSYFPTNQCYDRVSVCRIMQSIQIHQWDKEWLIEFLNAILDYTKVYGYTFN